MLAGCSSSNNNPAERITPTPLPTPGGNIVTEGDFMALTYNVAGLPEALTDSAPVRNHPQISPLLNGFDLVLVQEDFCHHALLAQDAKHPFQSTPAFPERPCEDPDRVGDGLNDFSVFAPVADLLRVPWNKCSGTADCKNDCLTPKGYSYARREIAPGVEIDVYNIHTDSGSCRGDIAARGDQFAQLADAIAEMSAERAVIVAGDSNLRDSRPGDRQIFEYFTEVTQTSDHCENEERCVHGVLDRVVVRGAPNLEVRIVESYFDPSFILRDEEGRSIDEQGNVIEVGPDGEPLDPEQEFVDLSDHEALAAEIAWTLFEG